MKNNKLIHGFIENITKKYIKYVDDLIFTLYNLSINKINLEKYSSG